jgi:hypothetical protein
MIKWLSLLSIYNVSRPVEIHLTAVFTGPPRGLGFQENTGSAPPVQLLLSALSNQSSLDFAERSHFKATKLNSKQQNSTTFWFITCGKATSPIC